MVRGLKFRIQIEEGLYYPCSENKDADQLRGYREADLRLCFRICKKPVFSQRGSYVSCYNGIREQQHEYHEGTAKINIMETHTSIHGTGVLKSHKFLFHICKNSYLTSYCTICVNCYIIHNNV